MKNNRKIFKAILDKNSSEMVSHETLLKKGFEFEYRTHYVTTVVKKNVFTFCYNYGYRLVEKDTYKVIKSFK